MPVSFSSLLIGHAYSRKQLADLWGYSSFHAIARGVVTPRDDNTIILFVTEEKQESADQYADRLEGEILHWEGPNDHFGEERMRLSTSSGDQIQVFYRARHHSDFTYLGQAVVVDYVPHTTRPSRFRLGLGLGR